MYRQQAPLAAPASSSALGSLPVTELAEQWKADPPLQDGSFARFLQNQGVAASVVQIPSNRINLKAQLMGAPQAVVDEALNLLKTESVDFQKVLSDMDKVVGPQALCIRQLQSRSECKHRSPDAKHVLTLWQVSTLAIKLPASAQQPTATAAKYELSNNKLGFPKNQAMEAAFLVVRLTDYGAKFDIKEQPELKRKAAE